MRTFRTGVAVLTLSLLSGCTASWAPNWLQVQKIDIEQGNIISAEQVERLEPGMSREEVRYLLGNPLLTDVFHKNRWDYVYYLKPGKSSPEQSRLTVFFEGDTVSRIEGGPAPSDDSSASEEG